MDMGDHALQVLLALVLVVGLVVALGYAMRRINTGTFRNGGEIRVVASSFLGPKERLLLVEVRGRAILLGITGQSIRPLGEFPAGEERSFEQTLEEARAS